MATSPSTHTGRNHQQQQEPLVLYEVRDRIAYLTMNRPQKRNALNNALIQALAEALSRAEAESRVRVIVLRGRGPAFCAGLDLQHLAEMQKASLEENMADSLRLMELFKLMYTLAKPLIAQVEGPALGGGAGLATLCDFIFATPNAQFGYTEVRIGFVPALVMVFLVRQLGERKARELLLTGTILSAKDAHQLGLVREVLPPEEISERIHAFATHLAKTTAPESIARTRWMLAHLFNYPFPQILEFAAEQNARARLTKDCQTGIRRFLQREALEW